MGKERGGEKKRGREKDRWIRRSDKKGGEEFPKLLQLPPAPPSSPKLL
jgi:hypothetical protein